jgi:hypothetical protein
VVRHQSDFDMITYFADRALHPVRVVRRHDGTVELTWRVDDCDDRFVRVTSSVHGAEYVLVSRDRRHVDACVLQDCREIFDWVSLHLAVAFVGCSEEIGREEERLATASRIQRG